MATTTNPEFTREEVGLALRNPGMPLEALRYSVTFRSVKPSAASAGR